MELEILKSEVFKEVEKRSSLEAANVPDSFEQLWASTYEGRLLDSYWIEGCMSAVQLFKRYLRNETVTHTLTTYDADEKLAISAEMPSRFSDLLEGSITTDLKMMLAANIVYRWMAVKAPDVAGKYNEEAASYADGLRLKLLYRDEPASQMQTKDADDTEMAKDDSELSAKNADDTEMAKDDSELSAKNADDTEMAKDDSELSAKDADDTEMAKDDGGTMVHKGMDRLKLTHYHGCNNHFKQGRDYGRRNERGPCDR